MSLTGNNPELAPLLAYIERSWNTLSRSVAHPKSLVDTKHNESPVLYLPQGMTAPEAVRQRAESGLLSVMHLPRPIRRFGEIDPHELRHGLLFLPNPYIVPGGFFNEMYGWDSYFIVRGLLSQGRTEFALGMVENFFFEIEHYGAILNANRTYYLTRSQPPFLTSMVEVIFNMTSDREWLARAYSYCVRDYEMWTSAPKLAGETGLSRFFDLGVGRVTEMGEDPLYFEDVRSRLLEQDGMGEHYLDGGTLTLDFYAGDRAMRESGFDVSFRFGPFSGSTHHYAPVCLNSLLFKVERDMERFATSLGNKKDALAWRKRSEKRRNLVNRLLWNEERGMFFDHDFMKNRQSDYEYATTFYALWSGLASPQQAERIVANLPLFEHAGGLTMSTHNTGAQWDMPYGWAPIHLIAVEGLCAYGFRDHALRLSSKFLDTVLNGFAEDGTLREKYNVMEGNARTEITAGYSANVIGFGWTNGVVLELLNVASLPACRRAAAAG